MSRTQIIIASVVFSMFSAGCSAPQSSTPLSTTQSTAALESEAPSGHTVVTQAVTTTVETAAPVAPVVTPALVMFLADVSCPAAARPCADEPVRRIVQSLSPSLVVFAGDVQYPSHSLQEYERSFLPVWGALRERALSVPGNHEYLQTGAAGYFAAWNESAGTGRFSTTLGDWRIIGINTSDGCRQVPCAEASEQYIWLEDLLRADNRCTIVVGHHPRWSSGTHGDTKALTAIWDLLERYRVEAYVAGHDHHYERVTLNTTQYVVGTGGADLRPASNQETVVINAHGALAMELRPGAASVRFESVLGPKDQHELLCS